MNYFLVVVAIISAAIALVIGLLFFVIRIEHPGRRRTNHKHIPACYDQASPPAEETEVRAKKASAP